MSDMITADPSETENEPTEKNEEFPAFFQNTNWFEQFFDPSGRTTREEFGRGWLLVSLAQMLVVIIGLALLASRQSVPGMVVLLAGLVLGSWAIGMLHFRRAHDAGRTGWLSLIMFIPMVLALLLVIMPAKEMKQIEKEAVAASTQTTSDQAGDKDAKAKASTESSTAEPAKATPKVRKGRSNGGHRGKPGKPPNPALQKGIGAVGIFAVLAFIMSIVSMAVFWRKYQQPSPNRWGDPNVTLQR